MILSSHDLVFGFAIYRDAAERHFPQANFGVNQG